MTVDIEGHAPDPVYSGQTVSIAGINIGICDFVVITYRSTATLSLDGGVISPSYVRQLTAPLTAVDSGHAHYVFPDFNLSGSSTFAMIVQAHYVLSGTAHLTASYSINATARPDTTTIIVDPPTYGYGIPNVEYAGPGGPVVYWKFFDPHDSNTATNTAHVPVNPNAMTSLFPTRSITTIATTAVDGQVILTEGQSKPAEWQFSGDIMTPYHYDLLRSWVYDRRRRVIITDHFGRDITCVLTKFDAIPKQRMLKYWRHTYTVSAIVVSVGPPTKVPS